MLSTKSYPFKRTATRPFGFTFATASSGLGYTFALQDVPNSSEFTSLFDEYKLYMVKILFRPLFNSQSAYDRIGSTTNLIRMPRVHFAIDNTDNTPAGTVGALQQYSTYDTWTCLDQRTKVFKIFPSSEYYRSSVSTGYGNAGNKWINCDATGIAVPHYGIKIYFENPDAANWNTIIGSQDTYEMIVTYYFHCRNVQ